MSPRVSETKRRFVFVPYNTSCSKKRGDLVSFVAKTCFLCGAETCTILGNMMAGKFFSASDGMRHIEDPVLHGLEIIRTCCVYYFYVNSVVRIIWWRFHWNESALSLSAPTKQSLVIDWRQRAPASEISSRGTIQETSL